MEVYIPKRKVRYFTEGRRSKSLLRITEQDFSGGATGGGATGVLQEQQPTTERPGERMLWPYVTTGTKSNDDDDFCIMYRIFFNGGLRAKL